MRERLLMPIVDDFALYTATDRGALYAAEKGLITGADVMMNQPTAVYAIREMRQFPKVSLGVHINFSRGVAHRSNGKEAVIFRSNPTSAGIDQLVNQTVHQIRAFQEMTGENPTHVSTHNHTHTDMEGQVFSQFVDAVYEAVGDERATLIRSVDTHQVRHCRAVTLQQGKPPLTPDEFGDMLKQHDNIEKPLDLLVHPGLPMYPNQFVVLSDDYTLEMREHDLAGLERIIESGVVQNAGYRLVSPTEWLSTKNYDKSSAKVA